MNAVELRVEWARRGGGDTIASNPFRRVSSTGFSRVGESPAHRPCTNARRRSRADQNECPSKWPY